MVSFEHFKKLASLLLMAVLLGSCSDDHNEVDYLMTIGFTSDTTAILVYQCQSDKEITVNTVSYGYCGVSMKLVDVRFPKVYWKSSMKSGTCCNSASQWNDSTIFLNETDNWLWTIGNSKPLKIDFNPNINSFYYWRPWKNNSVLGTQYRFRNNDFVIIDPKTKIVNSWEPTDENAWIKNCNDVWWGKDGGMCLSDITQRYFYSLIGVLENEYSRGDMVMFQYDDKGNIAQEPLFWVKQKYKTGTYTVEFTNSSGNVTEY